jgi:hypothetical protein
MPVDRRNRTRATIRAPSTLTFIADAAIVHVTNATE